MIPRTKSRLVPRFVIVAVAREQAKRGTQRVTDRVAQRILLFALPDPVTLPESFDLYHRSVHRSTFRICLTNYNP
jgi:hypothetical protein